MSAAFGSGLFVRCRGLLAPVRFAGVAASGAPPMAGQTCVAIFNSPAYFMASHWGAPSAWARPCPAPVCPPRPFSFAAANSATARGNISLYACAPLVRHPARLRFACALCIPHSLRNCRPLGGWGAPRAPAPRARAACSRSAPCAALAPLAPGATRPRFPLADIATQSGAVSPPFPSNLPLSSGQLPAFVRESRSFTFRNSSIILSAAAAKIDKLC